MSFMKGTVMEDTVKVVMEDIVRNVTVKVHVVGVKGFERRFKIGHWFIRTGCRIIGCKVHLDIRPPKKSYISDADLYKIAQETYGRDGLDAAMELLRRKL